MKSEIIRTLKDATIVIDEMLNTVFCEVESDHIYILCDMMDLNSDEQNIELWIDDVLCVEAEYLDLIANYLYKESITIVEYPSTAFTIDDRKHQLQLIFTQ